MQDLHMSIRDTDLSPLLSGQVALQHLARLDNSPLSPPPQLIRSLQLAGLTLLAHAGLWSSASNPAQITFHPRDDLADILCFTSASRNLPSLIQWLSSLSLPRLTYGSPSLALPPAVRRHQAEHDLLSLAAHSTLPRVPSTSPIIVSDASMLPSSAICAISCDLFGPFCLFTR